MKNNILLITAVTIIAVGIIAAVIVLSATKTDKKDNGSSSSSGTSVVVQTDPESESTFVWCVTAMQLERKDIRIIYCDEDFVIAERGTDGAALREGNTVVVSGTNLYEGKIIS